MNFDEQLADMLSNYPAIWDKKSASYRNLNKRENSFKELATMLNSTVETVSLRYKFLREKYRKEKLKLESAFSSGAGQLNFEPWPLMKTLSFLDMVQMKRKSNPNNIVCPGSSNENRITPDDENGEFVFFPEACTETFLEEQESQSDKSIEKAVPSGRSTPTYKNSSKRPKQSSGLDNMDPLVGRLVTTPDATASENLYSTFGKFVGQTLNLIAKEYQDDAVYEIQGILHKYKKKSNS